MLFRHLVVIIVLILVSCSESKLNSLSVKDLAGKEIPLSVLMTKPLTVIYFLSPECPTCWSYSITFNSISSKYSDKVSFMGIVPGKYFTNSDIQSFVRQYKIPFEIYLDEKFDVTNQLKATVTPEVFLLDKNGEVIYHGLIDNFAAAPGIHKQVVTEHYLADAIDAVLSNTVINVKNTIPKGCFIEKGL